MSSLLIKQVRPLGKDTVDVLIEEGIICRLDIFPNSIYFQNHQIPLVHRKTAKRPKKHLNDKMSKNAPLSRPLVGISGYFSSA